MQPNPDARQPNGDNLNLSLSDFLPDVFEEGLPPNIASSETKASSYPQQAAAYTGQYVQAAVPPNPGPPPTPTNPKVRKWVDSNFEPPNPNAQTNNPSARGLNPSVTLDPKAAPVVVRLRRQIPLLGRVKVGRWLLIVPVILIVLASALVLGLLYYNNVIGSVSPSSGALETYPGATRVNVDQRISDYIFQAEKVLPILKGAIDVPSTTGDNVAKVEDYYKTLMAGKGYASVAPQSFKAIPTAITVLGNMRVLYFTKGTEIARVMLITLSSDVTDSNLKQNNTLILLATGQR